MALERKVRRWAKSLVVVIPSQLAAMCGFTEGTVVEIEAIGTDRVVVKKQ